MTSPGALMTVADIIPASWGPCRASNQGQGYGSSAESQLDALADAVAKQRTLVIDANGGLCGIIMVAYRRY